MAKKKKTLVKLRGTLPYRIVPDEDWFIAKCELLQVNGQGKTRASAVGHLRDAVVGFLWVSMEDGTIHEVLKECGFLFVRLGDDAFWVAPERSAPDRRYETLKFSSRVSIRGMPHFPKRSEQLPANDFPWVVAVPQWDEFTRAV